MAGQPTPPGHVPPRNKALLRAYWWLVSLNRALLSPYLGVGRLTSHDPSWQFRVDFPAGNRDRWDMCSRSLEGLRVAIDVYHLEWLYRNASLEGLIMCNRSPNWRSKPFSRQLLGWSSLKHLHAQDTEKGSWSESILPQGSSSKNAK